MKKFLLITLIVVGFQALTFGQYAAPFLPGSDQDPEGFRDLKWGDPPTKDMTLDDGSEQKKYYRRKGDVLEIGDAKLSSISYGFWSDKLISVLIHVPDYRNFMLLREATFDKFGKKESVDPIKHEYAWGNPKGDGRTTVVLFYDEIRGGVLLMRSIKLEPKVEKKSKSKGGF